MSKGERFKIAREAAFLLYYGLASEFKQAKERAAKALGAKVLPSNFEVAVELDRLADEIEGPGRRDLIVQMRREALEIMEFLEEFHPRLVGSVWRGTACRGSDIDVLTYSTNPEAVKATLQKHGFKIIRTEWRLKTEKGVNKTYFHIFISLPSGNTAEVTVRSPEDLEIIEKCDIYEDVITGLKLPQLREILSNDPLRKFVPKEK
ncbi:nucleotidyltransferase domain-containing protein [Candidatus Bathyarchaeota archaeon]|nr:nucleotidyltransferase domain-containing protein [Candidatus Bathyarchaeota archaeon]